MGQSLVKQYTHIIFSTKHQQPLIIDAVENELHKYIGGICKILMGLRLRPFRACYFLHFMHRAKPCVIDYAPSVLSLKK